MEQKKEKSKFIKASKIIGNVLFYAFAGIIIFVAIFNGIDRHSGYKASFFGLHSAVVVSDSMALRNPNNTYLDDSMEQIEKFDLITFQEYKSFDDVKVYDVVTYYYDDTLIVHRVIDKYTSVDPDSGATKQFLVTKGDSNNSADTPFEYSLVRGKVIWKIPKVGAIFAFTGTLYFWFALFTSIFIILLIIYILKYLKPGLERRRIAKYERKKAIEAEVIEHKKDVKKNEINREAEKRERTFGGRSPHYRSESENLLSKQDSCKVDGRNYTRTSYFTENNEGKASNLVLQVYEENYED